MCNPAAVFFAISAASSVAQHVSVNRMADAQEDAINESLRLQQESAEDEASREQSERAREARRERGRVLAAAAEAGVGGEAVLAQLRDSVFQAGFDIATHEHNKDKKIDAARTEAQGRIDSIQTSSLLDVGLGVATAGFQAYNMTGKHTEKKPTKAKPTK